MGTEVLVVLKVSKSQKHYFLKLHFPKNELNIFLTSEKKLKIGDFGISKGLERDSDLASTFVGTAVYIAPEIHGGEKYNMMADLWALGVIFFEIITFKRPFQGHNLLQNILDHHPSDCSTQITINLQISVLFGGLPHDGLSLG